MYNKKHSYLAICYLENKKKILYFIIKKLQSIAKYKFLKERAHKEDVYDLR